ncbi:uncharacterized protein LOC120625546 [Pararge aegeria]|uniref:uncharacterized protein LOC120625546 n=1 Tax=Pararge aegeria TaxID=116150 RepID=UPI0019D2DB4F|nr:uncharacterized protein LOC120625546 [Pararge aegeria]
MKLAIISLASIIVPSLGQYAINTGLRADVTFGEENDRFDVTNLIRRQTKHLKPNLDPQSGEFRRRYKSKHKSINRDVPWPQLLDSASGRDVLRKRIQANLEEHVNNLANTIIYKIRGMRRNQEFAHHDNMDSGGEDVDDFNNNLRVFENNRDLKENNKEDDSMRRRNRLQDIVYKLHGRKNTRRTAIDPEKEILFHYAFPIDMKIEGFLQAPLV